MRWTPGYSSDDVDDRRGEGPASAGMGGAPLGILFWLFSRFGLPGLLIGGVALYFMGSLGSGGGGTPQRSQGEQDRSANVADDSAVQFVSFVLDDVQNSWAQRFAAQGQRYSKARMTLFSGSIASACGLGQRAMGPFYCPGDRKVYLDLAFYRDLHGRFGKPGDLAQAYVVAHEVGHHVQHLLGIDERTQRGPRNSLKGEQGASVRLELQADCFAGMWANSTEQRKLLEAGDLEGALEAASSIGDDRLQREATGTVQPEKWTHGSARERARWFKRGYELGSMEACDTFAADNL
ncbi:MAG: neutral zinc metallopeptidase [Polyangiales bacterium]